MQHATRLLQAELQSHWFLLLLHLLPQPDTRLDYLEHLHSQSSPHHPVAVLLTPQRDRLHYHLQASLNIHGCSWDVSESIQLVWHGH